METLMLHLVHKIIQNFSALLTILSSAPVEEPMPEPVVETFRDTTGVTEIKTEGTILTLTLNLYFTNSPT